MSSCMCVLSVYLKESINIIVPIPASINNTCQILAPKLVLMCNPGVKSVKAIYIKLEAEIARKKGINELILSNRK